MSGYVGRSAMDDSTVDRIENLLSYFDCHSDVVHAGGNAHSEWWVNDAVALMRDLLPEWSAFKTPVVHEFPAMTYYYAEVNDQGVLCVAELWDGIDNYWTPERVADLARTYPKVIYFGIEVA